MDFKEYHEAVKASTIPEYPDFGDNLVYPALGANDEAGELAGKVKKLWRDHGITHFHQVGRFPIQDPAKVLGEWAKPEVQALVLGAIKEIGDVLWYLDAMAYSLGTTLEKCAEWNVVKLKGRQERGTARGSGDDR